ncbi:hypothetical protein BDW67DRAFT_168158 [Aspergillus spinulosporus]
MIQRSFQGRRAVGGASLIGSTTWLTGLAWPGLTVTLFHLVTPRSNTLPILKSTRARAGVSRGQALRARA